MATLTTEALLAGAGLRHRVGVPRALLAPDGWAGAPDDEPGGPDAPAGEVVLRPLVLSDVLRLHRAAGEDHQLASALMIQQAMLEPALTVEQVHQLPAGLVDFLLGEVNRTSGLSIGADELEQAVHAPLTRACFVLSREFGWSPDQCAALTVGQVLLYLEMLGRGERP